MRSEFRGAQAAGAAAGAAPFRVRVVGPSPAEARARIATAKKSLVRSRVAKPLLTTVGFVTLLSAAVFVVAAVSSTGSTLPWDWTRMDWSVAGNRYTACAQHDQGPATIGCMLGASPGRPSSTGPPAGASQGVGPVYSVATIQDQPLQAAPAAKAAPKPAAKAAAGSNAARSAPHAAPAVGQSAIGTGHLVTLPANPTRAQVDAACQSALRAAQAQGPAVISEVQAECAAYLQKLPPSPGDDGGSPTPGD
jgi:hypothetical protein